MKTVFFLINLLLVVSSLWAQNPNLSLENQIDILVKKFNTQDQPYNYGAILLEEYASSESSTLQILTALFNNATDTDHPESIKYGLRLAEVYTKAGLYSDTDEVLARINRDKLNSSQIATYHKTYEARWLAEGTLDSALVHLDSRLQFANKDNQLDYLQLMQYKADLYNQYGRYQNSLEVYEQIKSTLYQQDQAELVYQTDNNIGFIYAKLGNAYTARDHFKSALDNVPPAKGTEVANIKYNLALIYMSLGRYNKSVKLLFQLKSTLNDSDPLYPKTLNALAEALSENNDLFRARNQINELITWAETNNNTLIQKDAYLKAAFLQGKLEDFQSALAFYDKHLSIRDSLEFQKSEQLRVLNQVKNELQSSKSELELVKSDKLLKESQLKELDLERQTLVLSNKDKANQLAISINENKLREEQLRVQQLEALRITNELQLSNEKLRIEKRENDLILLRRTKQKQLDSLNFEKKEVEQNRQILEQRNAIAELELDNKENELQRELKLKTFNRIIGSLGALLLLMALFGIYKLRQSNKIIDYERKRSDKLLTAILPKETAEELKTSGKAIPKSYKSVTVLFSDFTKFTEITSDWTPDQVIAELEVCFQTFDEIMEKHGIDRIKTIGDAYMAAGGISNLSSAHAQACINAAIDMQKFIKARRENKLSKGQPFWGMKIGLHSGPVVAGVVGNTKFAYDIWGDTVNLASRMEDAASDEMINLTEATLSLCKTTPKVSDRGLIDVKGIGPVQMFSLNY